MMLSNILKIFGSFRDKGSIWIAVTLSAAILFYAYGCESKTKSIIDPTRKVTRAELQTELDFLISTSKIRLDELDKKDEFKQMVFNQTVLMAQSGTVNPIGVLTSLLAIAGMGFGVDDVRLRRERKKRKNGSAE